MKPLRKNETVVIIAAVYSVRRLQLQLFRGGRRLLRLFLLEVHSADTCRQMMMMMLALDCSNAWPPRPVRVSVCAGGGTSGSGMASGPATLRPLYTSTIYNLHTKHSDVTSRFGSLEP